MKVLFPNNESSRNLSETEIQIYSKKIQWQYEDRH
jgi:hypothetical protein